MRPATAEKTRMTPEAASAVRHTKTEHLLGLERHLNALLEGVRAELIRRAREGGE